ncbi:MAG: ABC transporter ATP-binding protein [Gemmatimonadetes bacterium]|nr:ABC transporter ATP-binding protein [Gemmatimonadota bacterium]
MAGVLPSSGGKPCSASRMKPRLQGWPCARRTPTPPAAEENVGKEEGRAQAGGGGTDAGPRTCPLCSHLPKVGGFFSLLRPVLRPQAGTLKRNLNLQPRSCDGIMIRVAELQKAYDGRTVLGPVSLEIAPGETVGILGRNGSGKTTLLRILAGDLVPSAGAVWIDGVDAIRQPDEARTRVGYLPEVPPVYEDMRVGDYLVFAARLRGVPAAQVAARVRAAEERTQTAEVHEYLIRHLSHGYRQRVGLAQAIVHEPPLLILDEPTHDLDPVQIVAMRELVRALHGRHTVLLSSHILSEIREMCDRLLVVNDGRIVASGTEAELTGRLREVRRLRVSVRTTDAPDALLACIRAVEGVADAAVTGTEDGAVAVTVEAHGDRRAEVCRALVGAGFDVLGLERGDRELESVFLELVGGERAGA